MSGDLILERRGQDDHTLHAGPVSLTPFVNDDYWTYRVRISGGQAVLGFPKFSTIGIGFAQEEDWNTNLPYTCETKEIRKHIWHNRGDKGISKADVDTAIDLIRAAATEDRSS